MKSEPISKTQEIPRRFLENTLRGLRNAGLVGSQRGADGGYRLTRAPSEITLAGCLTHSSSWPHRMPPGAKIGEASREGISEAPPRESRGGETPGMEIPPPRFLGGSRGPPKLLVTQAG